MKWTSAFLLASSGAACAAAVQVTGDTPLVPLGLEGSAAAELALRDVQRDWYRRFGLSAIVLAPGDVPEGMDAVYVGAADAVEAVVGPLGFASADNENHGCAAVPGRGLACAGYGGDLGSVYALYDVSGAVLGVDPQHIFTEHAVASSSDPVALPDDWRFEAGAPAFEYRGWFINDEDQLSGLSPDPMDARVFDLATWDKVYQTLLRMGGNAVIVGTAAFPDEESFALAERRGLFVAEHHITQLGANTFQWPEGFTYSYAVNPEVQEWVWRECAEAQKDRKMLWTVGYRGLNDYPFWKDDPSFDTDAKRGALISEVIQTQVDIVKAATGDASPPLFTYLWDEMTPLYEEGFLVVPDEVTVVHADSCGTGLVPTHHLVEPGNGLYYHVAMESGNANQLAEMVPPHRVYSEVGDFVRKGATKYFILNLSDVRAPAASTAAVMDFVWSPDATTAPRKLQSAFLERWAGRQFGQEGQAKLGPLLDRFFDIPYTRNATADSRVQAAWPFASAKAPEGPLGEQYLASVLRELAQGRTPEMATAALQLVAEPIAFLEPLKRAALDARQAVRPERRAFYEAYVLTQIDMYLLPSLALRAAARLDADGLGEAAALVEALLAAERASEGAGLFDSWFQHEWLDGFANVRDVLRLARAEELQQPAPLVRAWQFGTGPWCSWFDYQQENAFPFLQAQPGRAQLNEVGVKMTCLDPTCEATATGGSFTGGRASIWFEIENNVAVYYSLDGSEPTPATYWYDQPFVITENTTVTARAYKDGVAVDPITRAAFVSVDLLP